MQASRAQPQTRTISILFVTMLVSSSIGTGVELPGIFENLGSPKFQARESAQSDLLAWARQRPEPAMAELFKQSQDATDPEVRERCLEILRSLVGDLYLKEGEGYIGIALGLNDEILRVPGDPTPRNAIRVIEVRANTPGQLAGIQLNDLIVALEGKTWREGGASALFREQVKAMKPDANASVIILRDGKLVDLKVKLGRRPLMADMLFNGFNFEQDAAEKIAKEAYFNRWLLQMKAKK
jgi:hypothetical protein